MKLIVDNRERKIISELEGKIEFNVLQLPLGDFIFVKDNIVKLVIERKSVADFTASIPDGRYRDQARRMRDGLKNGKPGYAES